MSLNIDRRVENVFYEHKMPPLYVRDWSADETLLKNLEDVAKSLNRNPIYLLKFFGIELGVQTRVSVQPKHYFLFGKHDAMMLQDVLDRFIQQFVLCEKCASPNTKLRVSPDCTEIKMACWCGHETKISLHHKVTTVIARNPMEQNRRIPE